MKQRNKQKVYFCVGCHWYTKEISLKSVYERVHAEAFGYGSSADNLLAEMSLNLLNLARLGKVDLKSFTVTDYGCGRSTAANTVGKIFSLVGKEVKARLSRGEGLLEVMEFIKPLLSKVNAEKHVPEQIEKYGKIVVQRYDIGIQEFSKPLEKKADVVFCNDVLEHIPEGDLPAFIEALQEVGEYIFASISLRDAVNYSAFLEEDLLEGAEAVEKPAKDGIVLEKNGAGDYIFSLHVSVFSEAKWQGILGIGWHLLPAQDYTAVSGVNFEPGTEFRNLKLSEIARTGFADFIPWPTPMGSKYEQDPLLFERTGEMQASKHRRKLEVLKNYPEGEFKTSEKAISVLWLDFIGDDPYSLWRLDAVDALAKVGANDDEEAAEKALQLVANYVCGDKKKINEWIAEHK